MKRPFTEIVLEARLGMRTPCEVSDIPFYLSPEWVNYKALVYLKMHDRFLTSDDGGFSCWDHEDMDDLDKEWRSIDPGDLPLVAAGISRNDSDNNYNIFRYLAQAILAGEVLDD